MFYAHSMNYIYEPHWVVLFYFFKANSRNKLIDLLRDYTSDYMLYKYNILLIFP